VAIDKAQARDMLDRFAVLKSERKATLDAKAEDVCEYIVPTRGRFNKDDRKPDKMHGSRGDKIVDSTPGDAHRVATNGMYSGLTPPSRSWHKTKFEDDDLNEWGPAKDYMDLLGKRRESVLRISNFYPAMHSSYAETISFANTCIYTEEFPEGGFRFNTHTFGEYYWTRNAKGKVDTVMRPMYMSSKQLIENFGEDKVSKQVRDAIKNNRPYSQFEVLSIIEPRTDRNVMRSDSANKPYRSVWLELSNENNVLKESGYDTFPFACGVWLLVGSDNYGCGSPGMEKLPDIKMLNEMEEGCLIAEHQELDPALAVPASMKNQALRRNPGGVNYYPDGSKEQISRLFDFKRDMAAAEAKSEAIRQRIKGGFYNDLFLMITNSDLSRGEPVTATQIREMMGEKMLQLGPFIERQEDELLDVIIDFVTSAMLRRPWIYSLPMPPEEIWEAKYKIEYISLLAQAQQQVGVRAIDDTTQYVLTIAPVKPDILDVYDLDEALRERSDLVGVPSKLIRSTDAVEEARAQRAQQQQAMEQAQMAMAAAEGAKNLAGAKMNPEDPNALTEIAAGMGA